ncbi:CocE/NonD family hydrolase [Nocardioides sp. GXQ0305]|uniref:CocE/NonD family hydrolase n=1 Tax=Nocardioides sp. GXQ0305 TaxID=3423912 RepID=UPI003D7CE611
MSSRLVPLLAVALALGGLLPAAPAAAADRAPATTATSDLASGWTPRGADHPATVTRTDLRIPMDDGVVLRGDLTLPAHSDGTAVDRRLPVVVTITAYNKSAGGATDLAGAAGDYLVKRGYAQLTVDARGTGSSDGVWGAFSRREARDAGAVVEWAHSRRRPWSNGRIGMTGPSYMGISQLFAASRRPAGLKAIFPQVPAADVYRDVVASGGQIDAGFIPLWLGLVTGTGLVPPAYGADDPVSGMGVLVDRLTTATTFTAPLLASAVLGDEPAYDGPFYRERSPLEVIDRVDVPTFLVAGQDDLFQRGTPLVFDALRERGVPTKMIVGPWDHLQGSSGAEVGRAGYGELEELQLRWFDRYVRGKADPSLDSDIAPLTYYEQGTDRWVRRSQWLARDLEPTTFELSGTATPAAAPGALVAAGEAQAGESAVPPVPVSGLCTRSANQWTAGILQQVWADNPCLRDHRLNDLTGVVFETAPMTDTLRIQGPINARLHTSTPGGDGMWSVTVEDVAPDGTVDRLTGGWQVVSHRALDRRRSTFLDGELVQPWHPFTREARAPLPQGEVRPVDVEVFPTGAAIRPGHRLRVSVQAFDVPHLVPPVPDLPSTLVPMTIHTSPGHPSTVTLPTR